MRSWQRRFKKAREAENNFRSYTNERTTVVNNTSGWVSDNNIIRFKVGPNPFDSYELEDYFSEYLGKYRSGLDQMVSNYAWHHGLDMKSPEYPIRTKEADLEGRVRGWRWEEKHKNLMLDFIKKHQPFTDVETFGCLKVLTDFRNTDEHRFTITPRPEVKVNKQLKIKLGPNGTVSMRTHVPLNHDSNTPWRWDDRGLEAKWGEYFGTGFEVETEAIGEHIIYVRFDATDPTSTNPLTIDVLSTMTAITKAISLIESDFLKEFEYIN